MKNIRKTLRFSEDEFEKIESILEKNELDFSTFARSQILEKKLKVQVEEIKNREFLNSLNRIGNNLNQIAKSVNSDNKILILKELINIEKALKDLRDGY